MKTTLFRNVEVAGKIVDVRVVDGTVTTVVHRLAPDRSDTVVEGSGGALLPGLHDHHVHLVAMAAARTSVHLGLPDVSSPGSFDHALRCAHASAPPRRWLRGIAYDESTAGPLDRLRLDALAPGRPVRVQHYSGAMWVVNTRALDVLHLATDDIAGVERDDQGAPTGRLFRLDALIRDRLGADPPDFRLVGAELLRYGVTGVTDATPTERTDDLEVLATAIERGDMPQQVIVTGGPRLDPDVLPQMQRGPAKLVIADHALPALDDVVASMTAARDRGRAVAVHCVTREALVLALAAWEVVGARPGDRVEHASVVTPELARTIAELGLTVVTQPAFIADRGDRYLDEVDPDDVPHLYPCRTLLNEGVPVAGSSDAPFGDADPWHAVAAAVARRAPSGRLVNEDQRLHPRTALNLYLGPWPSPGGPPRQLSAGVRADLCLLAEPLAAVLAAPSSELVVATMCSGRLFTFR